MTEVEFKKVYEIADELGKEEILLQLSEECAELIQACLKYRRATKGLTPKTEDETRDNIFEELADVMLNIEQNIYLFRECDIRNQIKDVQSFKADRWWRRTFISQNEA